MLRKLNELRSYKIEALDGQIGKVHDFYFDDETMKVRYLVDHTGEWFKEHLLLVPPSVLGTPDHDSKTFPVNLRREAVKALPDRMDDPPVHRQTHWDFDQVRVWPMAGYPMGTGYGVGAGVGVYGFGPVVPVASPTLDAAETVNRELADTAPDYNYHLRSAKEAKGYYIEATDGAIGHIEDFLADVSDWSIRYIEVDTKNWLPGRKVLVSPMWIDRFDYSKGRLHLNMTRQQVKDSPEYSTSMDLTRDDEQQLWSHYKRPGYWERQ